MQPAGSPVAELSSVMGVMKSRLLNLEPSLRKLRRNVSDSCRASSAAAMCATASRASPVGGGSSSWWNSGDWRKRQLRPMTSSGAAPHIAEKPADAKMIGLRCAGDGSGPDGSVTRQLSSENLTNVYRSQPPSSRASICLCM